MTEAAPADAAAQTASAATSAATTAPTSTKISYYAQYCFHLSPTLNQWCPMRVADVVKLDQYADFEGQNVFFHLNHPVKWVRIAGVVVACAEYYGRRVYTVDDGSGATIECAVPAPKTSPPQAAPPAVAPPVIDAPGVVVDIKGELRTYRAALQVHVTKLAVLRATEQEVQFWAKIQTFAQTTLYRPWVLDRRIVRKCRKAAMDIQRAKDEEAIKKEMEKERKDPARRGH